VKRGEEAFGRGEYLTHEQVGKRLQRFLCADLEFGASWAD
jgi:hypothetical protein